MKTASLSLVFLAALGAGAMAAPDRAPMIDRQIKQLEKKVEGDLAAGALTKPDADELKRSIAHVKSVESSEPSLTGATRRDLREDLSKIQKDLERKESQAKALASPSPSASP